MNRNEFRVVRIASENLVVEKLPDGSTAVFDSAGGAVHSLNASAAAAFDACRESCTVEAVATAMSDALDGPVTGDFARAAIAELETAGLVECSGQAASRRSVLRAVGGIALPVVLSLGVAEQRAWAGGSSSNPTPASISQVSPSSVCTSSSGPNNQVTFTITGVSTSFSQGTTQVSVLLKPQQLNGIVTIGTITVNSATSMTVVMTGFNGLDGYFNSHFTLQVTTNSQVVVTPQIAFGVSYCDN